MSNNSTQLLLENEEFKVKFKIFEKSQQNANLSIKYAN